MIQLIIYTIYAFLRCAVLIGIANREFPGILGFLIGMIIMIGGILEYLLLLTMIRKVSELEKKENSQKNHTL